MIRPPSLIFAARLNCAVNYRLRWRSPCALPWSQFLDMHSSWPKIAIQAWQSSWRPTSPRKPSTWTIPSAASWQKSKGEAQQQVLSKNTALGVAPGHKDGNDETHCMALDDRRTADDLRSITGCGSGLRLRGLRTQGPQTKRTAGARREDVRQRQHPNDRQALGRGARTCAVVGRKRNQPGDH